MVMWSGGLDSTYLVWKNLNEGNKVFAATTKLDNNKGQSDLEAEARKEMTKYFDEYFPKMLVVQEDSNSIFLGTNNIILPQVPIWILMSHYSFAFKDYDEKILDEIQIGYVMNDDAVSYIPDIKKLYKAYAPFVGDKQPKLTFPLVKKKKYDLLNELPEDIVKYISVCEYGTPKGEYCDCVSCTRHNEALKDSTFFNYVTKRSEIKECIEGEVVVDDEPEPPLTKEISVSLPMDVDGIGEVVDEIVG